MSDYFDRIERQIVRSVEAGAPRRGLQTAPVAAYLATAAAALLVIVVAGVFLLAPRSSQPQVPAIGRTVAIAFRASGVKQRTPSAAAVERSAVILRERLHTLVPGATVTTSGDTLTVQVPNSEAGARARILALAVRGQLAFYDWEADAITPTGKTVASQLQASDPRALEISQGTGALAPGDPGAGSMPFKQAAALAALRRGRIVVRAVNAATSSTGQYYVLVDVPALSSANITHPREVREPQTGAPDVSVDFTAKGATAFEAVTKRIAARGDLVSASGQTLNQHFAVALDDRLITVPYIDFKQYPDGITGKNPADIAGGFTVQSARELATILRYGPLPVSLRATG